MIINRVFFTIFIFIAVLTPFAYGNTSDSASSSDCALNFKIWHYCFIQFAEGTDINPIEVKVSMDEGGHGKTSTHIQYGANFNFRISAELGWHNGNPPPGEWRVALNDHDLPEDSSWSFLWKTYAEWSDIGDTSTRVWDILRWRYRTIIVEDNVWDIYPWGSPFQIEPPYIPAGSYLSSDYEVTIRVRNISLLDRAGGVETYGNGLLTLRIWPSWWNDWTG